MAVDKSKFTSYPSTLAPLLEEDESASRSPKGVHPGKSRPTPYVAQTSDPSPLTKLQNVSSEEEHYWNSKYEEAHKLYDDGENAETIAMIKDFIGDPECPGFVKIRFMILLSTCYDEHNMINFYLDQAEQIWDKYRLLNPEGDRPDFDKAMAVVRLDLDNTRNTVSEVFAAAQFADKDDDNDVFNIEQWAEAERNDDRRKSLGIDLKRLATISQVTRIEERLTRRIRALRKVVDKTAGDFDDLKSSAQNNSNGVEENRTAFLALAAELKEQRRKVADQQKELRQRISDLEELAKNMADQQKELRQRGYDLEELVKKHQNMAAATKQSSDMTIFKEHLTAIRELMAAANKERSSDMASVKELLSATAKERSSDMAIVKKLLAVTTKQSGTVKQSRGNMIAATQETVDPEAMQALKDEIATLKQELENLRPIKRFLDNHYAHRNTSTKDKSESGITEGSQSSRQDDQIGSSIPRHDSQSRPLDVFQPDTGASQDQLKNRRSDLTLRAARDMSHKLFRKLPGSKTSLHH